MIVASIFQEQDMILHKCTLKTMARAITYSVKKIRSKIFGDKINLKWQLNLLTDEGNMISSALTNKEF